MKHFFLIILCIVFFYVTANNNKQIQGKYTIIAIDSTDVYYIINAIGFTKDTICILSELKYKFENESFKKICIGEKYFFKLNQTNSIRMELDNDIFMQLDGRNFLIDKIQISKNGNLPFFTENLKGLYYFSF